MKIARCDHLGASHPPRSRSRPFRCARALRADSSSYVEPCGGQVIATVQTTAIDKEAGLIRLTTTLAHSSGEVGHVRMAGAAWNRRDCRAADDMGGARRARGGARAHARGHKGGGRPRRPGSCRRRQHGCAVPVSIFKRRRSRRPMSCFRRIGRSEGWGQDQAHGSCWPRTSRKEAARATDRRTQQIFFKLADRGRRRDTIRTSRGSRTLWHWPTRETVEASFRERLAATEALIRGAASRCRVIVNLGDESTRERSQRSIVSETLAPAATVVRTTPHCGRTPIRRWNKEHW